MKKKKTIIIAACLAALIILGVVIGKVSGGAARGRTVCLDAGHGGTDNGAETADGRLEKDDNLRLTLAVGEILKDNDVKVIYTRKKDEFVSLEDRADIANKKNVTLFVSLHRNSAEAQVSGIEAWIKNTSPRDDRVLAKNILGEVEKVGYGENRGVHCGYRGDTSTNYAVNSATEMPSCLVEMGFMSTEKDNELFDENFNEYAQAIAQGIINTLNDWD